MDENDLPDAEVHRMWNEAMPVRPRRMTAIRRYECPHMQASGWLQSLSCWVCGPLRATWVQRPVLPLQPPPAP